ncbi:uncharacterized protein EAF02_007325 [Botrytis sinoallii]|uniref:uncharacterized protein n=1 Tax=Botrytis sinoallii TaxID=1463999 RepID=UPI0018FF1F2A|nr:uncharacterized protein EAF02_007325 [Botrytis sinoallii]KAF7880479.1 hypothetical protein EAF02_007325 [Botrytis sinoallii]
MSASTSIIPGSSQANDSAGQIEKNDMSTGSDTALNRKGKGRQINLDTATRNVEPASPVSPVSPVKSSLPNLATGPISPVSPVERVEPKNFAGLQPEQAIGTANPEQATPASSAQSDTDGHSQPISIVKPNLVNPNEYDSICQLPKGEKSVWASRFQRAHLAQKRQEEEWEKLSTQIGQPIDGEDLKSHHTSYLKSIKPFNDTIAKINHEIYEENKKMQRDESSGTLVPIPLRGPCLQRLRVATLQLKSNSPDNEWDEKSSQEHWELVCDKLTFYQKEELAPIWSLCTALMLHRNAIMADSDDFFTQDFNDEIVHILKKENKKVMNLFNSKLFQGSPAQQLRQEYTNFAELKLPKFDEPPQAVFNVSKKFNVEIEDGSESDDGDYQDQEMDGMQPESTPDPPIEVQALREALGGWDGPLSRWLGARLGNRPAEAGFEELISQTDKNILEICTIQGVSHDFSLQTLLPKILHEFSTLVSDPIIENIATRINPVSDDDWVRCQRRIAGTRELISALRAPPNFADAMFFPNLLTRDVNEAQDTESYNDAENKALTQTLAMEYFNSIGGLNGILKKFLDGGSDSNQRSALRKLDENAKFFGKKCSDSYGIKPEQNSFILKEEDIKEYENMRRSVDRAREAVLINPQDERLVATLEDLYKDIRGNEPEPLASAVIGNDLKFSQDLQKLKAAGKSTVFKPLVVNDGTLSNQKSNSRFITPIAWKSPPGTIIENGIEKKIVGFRPVGNGEQLLLEWRNEGATRDAFELVASSVYKGKRKEYNGGKMEVGTKSELKSYSLRDCGFGGVAQVRRRDTTTEFIRAPPAYIFICHKGVEKWFTKSDIVSIFGGQIEEAIRDYNKEARQTLLTGNDGWKNSRHIGWKNSVPLITDSRLSIANDDDYVIPHNGRRLLRNNVVSENNSPATEEEEKDEEEEQREELRLFEEFKRFRKAAMGRAGRA